MKKTFLLKTLLASSLGINLACGPAMKGTSQSFDSSSEIFETVQMGDMILFKTKSDVSKQGATGYKHFNFVYKSWPNGVMKVLLPTDVGSSSIENFKRACREWEQASGAVRCEFIAEPPHNEPYLNVSFKRSEGCYSYVGAHVQNKATQMNLGDGCWNMASIKHELGHAFGLVHEHQRADRDNYITVNRASYDGDDISFRGNFDKMDNGDELKTPYDFESIMHYPRSLFALSGQTVINPKPEYDNRMPKYEGLRERITPLDAESLRAIYGSQPSDNNNGGSNNSGGFNPTDFESNHEFDRSSCPSERAKKLINGLYLGLFFRKADFPGSDGYCLIVHNEGPSGLSRIAKAMQNDPNGEWREKSNGKSREEIVTNLYRSFFGRDPDEGGFREYVNGNYTYERIIEILIQSKEFSCRYGYPITQPNATPCGS